MFTWLFKGSVIEPKIALKRHDDAASAILSWTGTYPLGRCGTFRRMAACTYLTGTTCSTHHCAWTRFPASPLCQLGLLPFMYLLVVLVLILKPFSVSTLHEPHLPLQARAIPIP